MRKRRERKGGGALGIGNRPHPLDHISDDVPVTVEITGKDPAMIELTMDSVSRSAGYDHRFFPVWQLSGEESSPEAWLDRLGSRDDVLNAAIVYDHEIKLAQCMNVPIYWRKLSTPFLHIEPGVVFEEKDWLKEWVTVSQLNVDLWGIAAYPSWHHLPFESPREEVYSSLANPHAPALFVRPDAMNVLGMFYDILEDPKAAARDYVRRIGVMNRRVWWDQHVHFHHEALEEPNRPQGATEMLRNIGLHGSLLSQRHQHNGLDPKKYELLHRIEGVAWAPVKEAAA